MARAPMWRRYLRFFGSDVESDVSDELRFHLDAKTRELMERGFSPYDARREAVRHFGDVGEVSALCRSIGEEHRRKLAFRDRMADWWYDVQHAVRGLVRSPWFACVAVATLAAGIGGATALFSFVDGWVIRSVRFDEPQQLVYAQGLDARRGHDLGISVPDYQDYAARASLVQSMAAWSSDSFTLSMNRQAERIEGTRVTANFFDTLRVRPALGRTFLPGEDSGASHVAVISHGFWKTRLNADAGVVGSRIELNGESYTVAGVLPEGFHFTLAGRAPIWIPLTPSMEERSRRQSRFLQIIARLKPGVLPDPAAQEMKQIASELASAHPETNRDISAHCVLLSTEIGQHTGKNAVLVVFAVTVGLLLIACSNIANLMLVRALARKRQAAIQLSLGAARARLVRQALVETLLVFLAAATVGAVLSVWWTGLITALIPYENRGYLPDYGEVLISWKVFVFAAGISLLTGLISGLAPAFEAADADASSVLKESGSAVSQSPKTRRLRLTLVAGQVFLATALLTSTAALVRTFQHVSSTPLGFSPNGLLTFRVSLDSHQYSDAAGQRQFFQKAMESLQEGRAAESVAIASTIPFGNQSRQTNFRLQGTAAPAPGEARRLPVAQFNSVSPDYFKVLRATLLSGRMFDRRDAADSPLTAVVNDVFAKQYLPGQSPIGRTLVLGQMGEGNVEIVGVVAEIRNNKDAGKVSPQIYVPFDQTGHDAAVFLIKSGGDPLERLPAIRKTIGAIDPWQPVYDAKTLEGRITEATAPFQILAGMLTWFGMLALALASVGVYGVVSFSVSQRTREIGIRAALGADRSRLLMLFMRQGLLILSVGLVPGLLAGGAAAAGLGGVIEGVEPAGLALPIALATTLLVGSMIVATLVPARRAASVDPLTAIRHE